MVNRVIDIESKLSTGDDKTTTEDGQEQTEGGRVNAHIKHKATRKWRRANRAKAKRTERGTPKQRKKKGERAKGTGGIW